MCSFQRKDAANVQGNRNIAIGASDHVRTHIEDFVEVATETHAIAGVTYLQISDTAIA